MQSIVKAGGLVFAIIFVVVWLILSWEVFTFDATKHTPPVAVGGNLVVGAGFLATTLATQTAAWLGIEIKKTQLADQPDVPQDGQGGPPKTITTTQAVKNVFLKVSVPAFSCWSFLVVSVIVLLLSMFKQSAAPEVYQTFMFSAIGWLAGAFAAAKSG